MKSAVTVSLVPEAKSGPFVLWDDLAASCKTAKELGFDAIELFAPGPDAAPDLTANLNDNGLSLAAVGTGAGWVKHRLHLSADSADIRRKAFDFVKSMIDFGAKHHAPAIIGSMQGGWGAGNTREVATGHLVWALQTLGEYAGRCGTKVIYEPLNRYETNFCNRLEEGVDLLKMANEPHVVLLADLFHMSIEEVDIAKAIEAAGDKIGHVHLADSNRRPAGGGHTNFKRIAAALEKIGYTGYISAESYPYPDSLSAAKATIAAHRKFFTAATPKPE